MAKRKAQGVLVKGGKAAQSAKPPGGKPSAAEGPPKQPTAAASAAEAAAGGRRKKKRRRTSGKEQAAASAAQAPEGSAESDEEAEEAPSLAEPAGAAASQAASKAVPKADGPAPASILRAEGSLPPHDVLAWLLWPLSLEAFFAEYWEKKPLHLKRGQPDYYDGLFSKADLDKLLRSETAVLPYGERLNLLRFDEEGAQRLDLNKGSKGTLAKAGDVEAAWKGGASIQVMHPQQFHAPAWRLLAHLERAFGSLFGANAYLTPAGSQDLAPHYDDVEVLMLQLEGAREWRLHRPPAGEEHPLPRDYSRDFAPAELGEPLLACRVERGDLLYIPRGTVFSGAAAACADGGAFSHHLTASTYYKTAWCNFLEKAISSALEQAAVTSAEYRAGLPVNFLDYMGTWHEIGEGGGGDAPRRAAFSRSFKGLLRRLEEFVDLDATADELAVDFVAQRLPPIRASGSRQAEISLETRVRFLDPAAARMMVNPDPETSEPQVLLFHSTGNSRELHMCRDTEAEEDVGCLRFDAATFMQSIRVLCKAGASFVRCGDLPLKDESDRVALCENLNEAGLLELAKEG